MLSSEVELIRIGLLLLLLLRGELGLRSHTRHEGVLRRASLAQEWILSWHLPLHLHLHLHLLLVLGDHEVGLVLLLHRLGHLGLHRVLLLLCEHHLLHLVRHRVWNEPTSTDEHLRVSSR